MSNKHKDDKKDGGSISDDFNAYLYVNKFIIMLKMCTSELFLSLGYQIRGQKGHYVRMIIAIVVLDL